jgi:hypothetical protein
VNQFNVFVDGIQKPKLVVAGGSRATFQLCSGLASAVHSVIIAKRSESSWSSSTIDSIIVDNGADLQSPPALPARRIEYLGDSHSLGYANEWGSRTAANRDSVLEACTNTWLSYGPRAARAFGAQWFMEAISGISLVTSNPHPFPDYFHNTLVSPLNLGSSSPKWNFSSWKPDVVIINLGINDAGNKVDSNTFAAAYKNFVDTVRAIYGNPIIICMASTQYGAEMVAPSVKKVVKADSLAGKPISFCSYTVNLTTLDWHPSVSEDSIIAAGLIAKIAKATGWSLTSIGNRGSARHNPGTRDQNRVRFIPNAGVINHLKSSTFYTIQGRSVSAMELGSPARYSASILIAVPQDHQRN